MKKAATEVDRHVGTRVRLRRMIIGMSQERLGEALGLTFQQVQKYEKGTNRISASRLQHISEILGVPIDFFYDGSGSGEGGTSAGRAKVDVLDAEALKLLRAFHGIPDPAVRRKIIELCGTLADVSQDRRSA